MLDRMRNEVYQRNALPPAIGWKNNVNPGLVENIQFDGSDLSWQGFDGMRYAVYAIPSAKINENGVCFTTDYLLGISFSSNYSIPEKYRSGYTYAVSVVDRYGNEFSPRYMGVELQTSQAVSLTFPSDERNIASPFEFKWSEVSGAVYVHEVALDEAFTNVVSSRELTTNKFSSFLLGNLINGETYYWRVKTRKPNCLDVLSSIYSFQAENFRIISPAMGSKDVSISPVISWTPVFSVTEYTVEIAKSYAFGAENMVHSKKYTGTEITLPAGILVGALTYYVRIKASVGEEVYFSEITSFTTEEAIPDIPAIISPVQNQVINASNVEVRWTDNYLAKSFRVEIHPSETFIPARNGKVKTVPNFQYSADFDNLTTDGVYYVRVRADYGVESYTDWSDIVKFEYIKLTGVENIETNQKCFVTTSGVNTNLVIQSDAKRVKAEIVDISGRYLGRIADEHSFSGEQRFQLPQLKPGVYIIVVNMDGKVTKVKFIQ